MRPLWIVPVLLVFSASALAEAYKPELGELNLSAQQQKQSKNRIKLVQWMPSALWAASMTQGGTPQAAQEPWLNILDRHTLLFVLDATVGTMGAMTFRSDEEMRKEVRLLDDQDREYTPLAHDELEDGMKGLLGLIQPMIQQAAGQMGQNMHPLVFPAVDKDGKTIAVATQPGQLRVKVGDDLFRWRLPLGPLIAPRECPVDAEVFPGNYAYCPYHGKELVAP